MTFTDIVNEVTDRLNLTSAQAIARVGRSINERYKEIASAVGIDTIERTTASATTTPGNRSLTFGPTPVPVEKILSVFNPISSPPTPISEISFDEMRNNIVENDPPQQYAIQLMGSNSVTIMLSSAVATAFVLDADVLSNLSTLSGVMIPAFAEDFHNILTYYAMAVELDKMEKYDKAEKQYNKSEQRLSELRLYIASSAYKDIVQGKTSPENVYQSVPLV